MHMFVESEGSCSFDPGSIIGVKYQTDCQPVKLGTNAHIRSGTVIYADVQAGDYFHTGHNVVVREHTICGNHVSVGTNSIIEGQVAIGDFVKLIANCYIPTHVKIGNRVFLGPNVTLTNDRYPLKMRDQYRPEGPIIEDNATLAAGVIVCPGVRIGHHSFVAAGALVTKDVPPYTLAVGAPAKIKPLTDQLNEPNMALSWRRFLHA
jgi:acetyltransferase-like isoleucine patch superfamily enzyme